MHKMTHGYVDVTFRDENCVARILQNKIIQIDVIIQNLPFEIDNQCVFNEMGKFGNVFLVLHQRFRRGMDVANGNRIVEMIIERDSIFF